MSQFGMLSHLQILQYHTCSHHASLDMLNPVALHVLYAKESQHTVTSRCFVESPVLQLESGKFVVERRQEHLLPSSFVQHLLRLEIRQQPVDILHTALAYHKLSRRNIQEANTTHPLAKMNSSQEIILATLQNSILHGNARCNQFRNSPLYQFLCQLRVLQLVTDGNPTSRTHQLGQIRIQGMIRESSHFHLRSPSGSVISPGQRNTQDIRSNYSVVRVCFVKIPTTEQQQGIGMLGLQVIELLHHGCKLFFSHLDILLCPNQC